MDRERALGGQDGARGAAGGEHGDGQAPGQRAGPGEGGVERTDDEQLTGRPVADGRDGLGIRHRGGGDQCRDLRRGGGGFGRPAAGLTDVDEADRLRPAALLGNVAQQALLLRARDEHVAARAVGELREFALAQRGVHGHGGRQRKRAAERGAVERHRAVAVADEQRLVGDGHRNCPRSAHRRAPLTPTLPCRARQRLQALAARAAPGVPGETPRSPPQAGRGRIMARVASLRAPDVAAVGPGARPAPQRVTTTPPSGSLSPLAGRGLG